PRAGPLLLAAGMPLAVLAGTAWARPADPAPIDRDRGVPATAAADPGPAVHSRAAVVEVSEVFVCPLTGLVVGPDDGRTDDEALVFAGLTADQLARYQRLRAGIDIEAGMLDAMNAPRARWKALNEKWMTGLQKIITAEQLQKVNDYWAAPTRPAVPRRPGGPAAVGGG
ncbi:MAG TPA: hypothetical protein VM597_32695, partial [Gemmataceae bacterium]|nr:hypothetical protein [Gemmataceae bacterium]